MKRESGTCNLCSAPCSSCLHINWGLMGSKGNEFSDENCQGNGSSLCSTSSDVLSVKSSTTSIEQHAPCESSNLLSVNLNHDSFSENSKENVRCSGPYSLSDGVKIEPNTSKTVGPDQLFMKHQCDYKQVTLQAKIEKGNYLDDHEDHNSCFSAVNTTNKLLSIIKEDTGKVLGSASSSVPEKSKTTAPVDLKPDGGLSGSVVICTQHHNSNVNSIDLNAEGSQVNLDSSVPDCGRLELRSQVQKDTISDSSCKQMLASHAHGETENSDVLECNSELLLIVKEEIDNTSVGLTTESLNSSEKNVEKLKSESPAMQESSVQSQHQAESDEYDILEHDVKVCDICGDAGREDLLAICSLCSDGAEHTYCMREKMEKVPEGNWLCEECKLDDANNDQKQDKEVMQSDIPRSKLDKQASVLRNRIESISGMSKRKNDIVDTKITGKRPAENLEVTSVMKKRTLELPSTRLPMVSSLHRTSTLSRDSSFRNLEKGKLKPAHHSSFGTNPNSDTSEPAFPSDFPNKPMSRGSLMKSNSFNFARSKGAEHVPEVVSPRHKLSKEPGSLDIKDRPVKTMGKSMSFKHVHPGRKNPVESRVKMLPSKFPLTQDTRGLKQVKEPSILERKSSFRSEGQANSTIGNTAIHTSKGEVKGQQCLTSVVGGSSVSEIASTELKSNQSLHVHHVLPNVSHIPEKSFGNTNESIPIPLARPVDSADLSVKREKSVNYKKPNTTIGGKNVSTPDNHQPLDNCSVKCSKEKTNEDNKLKAAIEAAMLKKPGIYRKKRDPDQSNGLTPNLNYDLAFRGQISTPSITRSDDNLEVSQSLPSNVEVFTRALSAPLKMSTIPQHDFAWIGGLQIYRSGKFSELRDGFQAHISTCASPKVLDMTRKLSQKIVVNEVPRISTWPMQFQDAGATEDNIALYFFAKDLESYEKSYKGLLDTMIKNDLALKGIIDGVELLIFPSNRLPQESQRWNMMFFLWGVFKGKRTNPLEKSYDLVNQGATDTLTSPYNLKSSEVINKDLPVYESHSSEVSPSKMQASLPLSRIVGGTSSAMVEQQHADLNEPATDFNPTSNNQSGCTKPKPEKTMMIPFIVDLESDNNVIIDKDKPAKEECQANNWQVNNNHKNYHFQPPSSSSSSSTLNKPEPMEIDQTAERHFFPINPQPVKDFPCPSSRLKHDNNLPDLELALGAPEVIKPKQNHGMLPFLSPKVDQKFHQREEDSSASLSLSLSFKFEDNVKATKPRQNFKSSSLPPNK